MSLKSMYMYPLYPNEYSNINNNSHSYSNENMIFFYFNILGVLAQMK